MQLSGIAWCFSLILKHVWKVVATNNCSRNIKNVIINHYSTGSRKSRNLLSFVGWASHMWYSHPLSWRNQNVPYLSFFVFLYTLRFGLFICSLHAIFKNILQHPKVYIEKTNLALFTLFYYLFIFIFISTNTYIS